MIGRLTGTLVEKNPPQLLLDVQGVAYEVDVPMSTFYNLPAIGERIVLFTHLVVREPGLLGIERMTPVELVTESTPELIRLRCTKDELAHMPLFITTNYLPASPGSLPGYGAGVMLWPYVGVQSGSGINHENTPPDELAIHRGSHVFNGDIEGFD
jgi:hypothetical protein